MHIYLLKHPKYTGKTSFNGFNDTPIPITLLNKTPGINNPILRP